MERRKGLEQQSEELTRIQKEQAEQLRKEQERLQRLADERKATDNQLQVRFVVYTKVNIRKGGAGEPNV